MEERQLEETSKILEEYDRVEDQLEDSNNTYQPLCFSKNAFKDQKFDIDVFISDFKERKLRLPDVTSHKLYLHFRV